MSQRLLATLWAAALIVCVIFVAQRLASGAQFDTSILALLPDDEHNADIKTANQIMAAHFSNRLLLLVGSDRASEQQLLTLSRQLTDQMRASNQFLQVDTGMRVAQQQLAEFYQPYRYQLLTQTSRAALASGDTAQLQSRALGRLYNPASPPRAASLIDDPFGLLDLWLQALQPGGGFSADAWGLTAHDGDWRYRVISAEFAGNAFDLDNQHRVVEAVNQLQDSLLLTQQAEGQDYSLLRSGLVFHAAAGAEQARREISTIGAGSVILVTALLLWHFRRPAPLLMPLLSIGAGLLVALAAALWVFGRIHVVTLAFGASLVGVSIDYALHYLCASRSQGSNTLRYILPGISLGLLSSVIAYAAQALTPFPGLQQMAVFSAAGLVGAWLTVVCWFPILKRRPDTGHTLLWRGLTRIRARRKLLTAGLLLTGCGAMVGWFQLHFSDSLTNLQNSPPALVQDEQTIQRLSQQTGSGRFFLITAPDPDTALQRQESLRNQLDQLVARGELQSYLALSQFIPSRQRQEENYRLLQTGLYESPEILDGFFASLGAPSQLSASARQTFRDRQMDWLTPADWSRLPVSRQFPYLWITDDAAPAQRSLSVISLGGVTDPGLYQRLGALAQALPGVQFVDRINSTSELLARYRVTVSQWVLLAYLIVTLLLCWRFGRATISVLIPPLGATALTLGLLALFGQSLNLFNIMATLLILGIGLDTGIFLRESHGAAHCWEAVTLSSLTSVFAFGLLALSATPVLHHFGITVLLGITLTWLLVFLTSFGRLENRRLNSNPTLSGE